MNGWYVAGIAAGVLAVGLVGLLVGKSAKARCRFGGGYDERQIAAQGRAHKLAFITLGVLCMAYGLADTLIDGPWCSPIAGVFACLCVSIGVWATVCVMHDAYFRTGDSMKYYTRLFGLMGLFNLAIGVMRIHDGSILEDGALNVYSMNPMVGLLSLWLMAVILVKQRRDRHDPDRTEEP